MASQITAAFEVTNWDEQQFDERNEAAKLTSAKVARSYSGAIEGDSVTVWVMAYADDGSATFVGVERITGTVDGRSGTLVLQHVGAYRDGAATAELTALGSSSGGALAGVSGRGDFIADPGGKVRLELTFP